MVAVRCLLASLSFVSLFATAEPTAPAPASPPPVWAVVGEGSLVKQDVLISSVEPDPVTFSTQFILRSTYSAPIKAGSHSVKQLIEQTLVLCRENLMVTMSQLQYDEKGEHVATVVKATVYENPDTDGMVVTETIRWACKKYHTFEVPAEKEEKTDTLLKT